MPTYTFIAENSSVNLAMLKQALRISHDAHDGYLKLLLRAAKDQADQYCQSNFTDYNNEVPAGVDVWVLQTAMKNYEQGHPQLSHRELEELGGESWTDDYFVYFRGLAPYRREVGFA